MTSRGRELIIDDEFGRIEFRIIHKFYFIVRDSRETLLCIKMRTYIGMTTTTLCGGARGVMVIVAGNGHGDTSSNPGRD